MPIQFPQMPQMVKPLARQANQPQHPYSSLALQPADQIAIRFGAKINQTQVNQAVAESSAAFANKMLTAMADTATTGNTVISPVNTYFLMQLLQTGATQDTATEINNAMSLDGVYAKGATKDQVVSGVKTYLQELSKLARDTGITLEQAYGIWARPGKQWHPDFKTRVANLNGESDTLRDAEQINNWAASKTNNKIKDIVSEDEIADAKCILASATYLLSNWRSRFEEEATYKDTFNGLNGPQQVDMMHQTADFKTIQDNGDVPYVAINMPYGEAKVDAEANELSMSVFVPKEGKDLAQVYRHLFKQNGLQGAVEQFNNTWEQKVALAMPKFTVTTTTDTKEVMQNMGVRKAFEPSATFGDMMPIYIGFMRQKAFIDVNEKGTEAAAVDVAGGLECAMVPNPPTIFQVDKPFVSVIHDKQGRILFVSTMTDIPTEAAGK